MPFRRVSASAVRSFYQVPSLHIVLVLCHNYGDPVQDYGILSDILHFVIAMVAVVGYPCPGMEMAIGLYRPPLI